MTTQQPPQGPHEPNEKLPGEAELAALYRKLPQHEPGPALDTAVLRAAAQAVAGQSSAPAARKRRPRWPIALGSAATLILAAGLGWHMRELPSAVQPAAVSSTDATQGEPAALAAQPATVTAPAEMAASAREAPKQSSPRAARIQPALPPPPAHKLARRQSTTNAADSAARLQEGEQAAPRPGILPASPAGGTMMYRASPPASPAARMQVQSMAAPSAAPATGATPALDEMAPAMAPPPPAPPAPPASPAPAAETAPAASDTPAQELDKIRLLFAQGQRDEARQRLTAFHRAHPQWELPAELRAHLRDP